MRYLLVCLIALGVFAREARGETVIRVLTYNIHHAEGTDGVLDIDRIVQVIRAVSPDIVCLQEVDRNLSRTNRLDMPALFAEKTGLSVVFEPNYRFDDGHYGNAILSRYPIVAHVNVPLPNPNNAEPRGCIRADLDVAGQTLRVFNTHLGLKPDERLAQANTIVELVGNGGSAIVAGDLNATPESGPLEVLLAGLRDTGPGAAPSSPSTSPKRRIDYVLTTPDIRVTEGRTLESDVVAVASDHRPYLTVIVLPESPSASDGTAEFNSLQNRNHKHD